MISKITMWFRTRKIKKELKKSKNYIY